LRKLLTSGKAKDGISRIAVLCSVIRGSKVGKKGISVSFPEYSDEYGTARILIESIPFTPGLIYSIWNCPELFIRLK
jgi:hypothetical protein